MSEYLGRAFERDLRIVGWLVVLAIGIVAAGSFAAGYFLGRSVAVKEASNA